MPPIGTEIIEALPLKGPLLTILGTEVAVAASRKERARARVKKEVILNIK